jgi:hypothetical protein
VVGKIPAPFSVDSTAHRTALTGTGSTCSPTGINFIFGINASATLGGIAACENAGRLDIAHASSGAEPPILALLKKPLSAQGGGVVWDIGYGKSAVHLKPPGGSGRRAITPSRGWAGRSTSARKSGGTTWTGDRPCR